jgi:AcrR family transcriptional regulator
LGPGEAQPPGRGPAVRAAVLAATLAELADTGYAALTIENIARRAGVHKTTIYRRWADRESLVADVLSEHIATDFPIPDTGSAEADLRQLAHAFVAWVTSPTGRMIFAAVYSDAARISGISDVRRELFEYGPRRTAVVIERAIERGELPAGTDPAAVLRTLIAPIYFQLTVTAEPVDPAAADQAAQIALAAARAGVFRRAAGSSPAAAATPVAVGPGGDRG